MDDPRFSAMHTAATFKKIRKDKYETQVDDRFKEMLTAEKFSLGPGVKTKKQKKKQSISPSEPRDGSDAEGDGADKVSLSGRREKTAAKLSPALPQKESRLEYLNRLARGEVDGSSSSDDSDIEDGEQSESDSSSSGDESDGAEHRDPLRVQEEEIGEIEEATHRLAIQNCEWNNLRADDLMVILQSFCTPGMQVQSVTVYPSDFGIARMKEEAIHGPPKELWKKNNLSKDEAESSQFESESDSGVEKDYSKPKTFEEEEFNNVALRAYELSKLRFYFAVAVCDSSRTAESLYAQLDGIEFEHSAMVFDMRFVPDDISFADRKCRDKCKGMPGASYKPPEFVVKALTHSKVECTWDKDEDLQRSRHLSNISSWRNLHDSDLQQYLADSNSDDSEQSGNEEAQGKRKDMRKMLLGDDSDGSFGDDFFAADNDGEDLGGGDMGAMSYSFVPEEKEDKRAQEMKKRMEEGLETPQEAAMRRKEARRAQRMQNEIGDTAANNATAAVSNKQLLQATDAAKNEPATAAQLRFIMGRNDSAESLDEDEDYDMHALSKAEKQRKKKAERLAKKKNKVDDDVLGAEISAGFSVNTADERFFPALRNSANYGIDPTSSEFKPTEGMNKILREQRKQRQLQEEKMETDLRQADGKNNPAELPEDGKRKLSKLDDVGPLVDRLKKKYKASTTK